MPALRRSLAGIVALGLGLGGVLVVAAPASAAVDSYLVTDPSGDVADPNSLPWAVAQAEADPDHTDITFDLPAGTQIVLLANLVITTDVTITGPGSSALTVVGQAGAAGSSVFDISGSGPVSLSGLTIAPGAAGSLHGIDADPDSLILADLALDGFDDDNVFLDNAGALEASDIVTTNSGHDGFSYVSFAGGPATVRNVTATGNGDNGLVLGIGGGTLTASDLTATGNGGGIFVLSFSSTTTLSSSTASGNDLQGVLIAAGDGTVTASDITSTGNGVGAGCGCGGPGIAVQADTDAVVDIVRATVSGNTADVGAGISLDAVRSGASVAISHSSVTGNHAVDGGSGVGGGIAISDLSGSDSSVSITDTVISGNDAEDAGGGVYLSTLGVNSVSLATGDTGPVTIARTTIDGNTASYGAGILFDGSYGTTSGEPALTVQDTTVSNNTASEEGGGLYLFQDPGYAPATVLLTGSTVSGNIAQGSTSGGNGGAFYVESAGPSPDLAVRIEYSTIADNDPPGVGGVFVDGDGVALTLLSSILSGNERGDLSFPASIASFAASWSLIQDPSLAGLPIPATNLTGVDPKLGPLANNGGPTKTHLVAPGSPAFNAGDPAFVGAGLVDQRGQARVYQRVDMGAVEWHPELANTGSTAPEPEPPLVALLLILSGLALVAFSRLQAARSIG